MGRESKYRPVWQWPFFLLIWLIYWPAEKYVNWCDKHL